MATGGLHNCPKCRHRVRDEHWLNGTCWGCGFEFGQMDPDALAAEIEHQKEEAQKMGCSPAIRGLIAGGCTSVVLFVLLQSIFREASLTYGQVLRKMLKEVGIDIVVVSLGVGLTTCAMGKVGLRRKWDSVSTWVYSMSVAIPVGIAIGIVLFLYGFMHC